MRTVYLSNLLIEKIKTLTSFNSITKNRPSQVTSYPYMVVRFLDLGLGYPEDAWYMNIDIYEKEGKSSTDIENLADTIEGNGFGLNATGLDELTINDANWTITLHKEQRQTIPAEELVGEYAINLRYEVTAYNKSKLDWRI